MNDFELLRPHLTDEQAQILEDRADAHSRFSAIGFKILELRNYLLPDLGALLAGKEEILQPTTLVLRIAQGKSHAEIYFDNKRLAEIGKELLEGLGEWRVITRPIPYKPKPTDVVTAAWINQKITERGVKLKDLSVALGIDANTLSAYRCGLKPLSGPVKAAFFYYFSR